METKKQTIELSPRLFSVVTTPRNVPITTGGGVLTLTNPMHAIPHGVYNIFGYDAGEAVKCAQQLFVTANNTAGKAVNLDEFSFHVTVGDTVDVIYKNMEPLLLGETTSINPPKVETISTPAPSPPMDYPKLAQLLYDAAKEHDIGLFKITKKRIV